MDVIVIYGPREKQKSFTFPLNYNNYSLLKVPAWQVLSDRQEDMTHIRISSTEFIKIPSAHQKNTKVYDRVELFSRELWGGGSSNLGTALDAEWLCVLIGVHLRSAALQWVGSLCRDTNWLQQAPNTFDKFIHEEKQKRVNRFRAGAEESSGKDTKPGTNRGHIRNMIHYTRRHREKSQTNCLHKRIMGTCRNWVFIRSICV